MFCKKHVAHLVGLLPFHQVLKLDFDKPEDFLTYCEKDDVTYRGEFQNPHEANKLVKKLWPEWVGPLEAERPLQMHYPGKTRMNSASLTSCNTASI